MTGDSLLNNGCWSLRLSKIIPLYVQEILLVLDGTTGLNMLPQAREFNEVIFPSLPSTLTYLGTNYYYYYYCQSNKKILI